MTRSLIQRPIAGASKPGDLSARPSFHDHGGFRVLHPPKPSVIMEGAAKVAAAARWRAGITARAGWGTRSAVSLGGIPGGLTAGIPVRLASDIREQVAPGPCRALAEQRDPP